VIGSLGGRVAAAHPPALADAVNEVLGEDEQTRRLGARARAERFPWARTIDAMLELHGRLGAVEPHLWPAA
jgi:alpha-1,6-mannosyltransferase